MATGSAEPRKPTVLEGRGVRLDSWKEIAVYLKRDVRTVQRWEAAEGLPVHRHAHQQRSSVYAFSAELDRWWTSRKEALDPGAEAAAAAGRPRRWWWYGAAALALFALGLGAWYLLVLSPSPGQLTSRPFTAAPGVETYPDFSPDGTRVAYLWRKTGEETSDIYVRPLAAGDSFQLTRTPGANEITPVWSPEGNWIAFFRREAGKVSLLVAPSAGGPERRISSEPGYTGGLSWTPDGKVLITAVTAGEHQLRSLYSVAAATGERRRLMEPPAGHSDLHGAVSADGRTLVFVRVGNYGIVRRVMVADFSRDGQVTGQPAPVGQVRGSVEGISWIGAEKRLLYAIGCCSSGLTSGFWTVRPGRNEAPKLLFAVPGVQFIQGRLSPDGRRLAYWSSQTSATGFWRVDLNQDPTAESPIRELPVSSATNLNVALSPDGRRFAYASTRSGGLEVWTSRVDGSEERQITDNPGVKSGMPRWSPDGSRISFDSSPEGNSDVFVVNSDGGAATRLTTHPAVECCTAWSADGQWLYFQSNRTGEPQIWKMAMTGGPESQLKQVTRKGGFGGFESPDGKHFYYTTAYEKGALRRVPAWGGEEETLVPEIREVHDLRVTRSGAWFLTACKECDAGKQPHVLRRYRFPGGPVEEAGRFRLPVRMGFSVAPDESFLIVNGLRPPLGGSRNILLVEGLR